jgi:hypothetical protein
MLNLLMLLLAGCGCTEMGCWDTVAIDARHEGRPSTIQTGTVTVGDQIVPIDCVAEPDPLDPVLTCDDDRILVRVADRDATVEVELVTDDGLVLTAFEPDWEGARINGAHCPVACYGALQIVDAR